MMEIEPLPIDGLLLVTPHQHVDDRGVFLEAFRGDLVAQRLGHRPDVVQANVSTSSRGTVRGIHFADVPPGQGKYVMALSGALLDVVVDIRVGSPTFGQWEAVHLDPTTRRAVYVSEGLGHAICALEDDTTAMYLCTATYDPAAEHGVQPLDPELAIDWPGSVTPLLSAKDAAAPTLAEAERAGLLPRWDTCRDWAAELAARHSRPKA